MLSTAIKEDGPVLVACGTIYGICAAHFPTLHEFAAQMQDVGKIAAGLTAIIVLIHRVYVIWKGRPE